MDGTPESLCALSVFSLIRTTLWDHGRPQVKTEMEGSGWKKERLAAPAVQGLHSSGVMYRDRGEGGGEGSVMRQKK